MHYSISIPMIAPLFSVFLYQFLVCFLSMQIFFFCCHAAPDMPLLFIYFQHISHLFGKRRINLLQSVCTILMYCTFANPKFLRCLSDRCIIFYNKFRDFHSSFFNIIFQKNPCIHLFTMYAGEKTYILARNIFHCFFSHYF